MAKAYWLFLVMGLLPALALARDESQTITILGTADWKGRFAVDTSGRGGLAALRAYHASLDHKKDRGHTLLFHTGTLTSAETHEQFVSALNRPAPGLVAYMRYAALGLPALERGLGAKAGLSLPAPFFSAEPESKAHEKPDTQARSLLLGDGLVYSTSLDVPRDRRAEAVMAELYRSTTESRAAFGVVLLPEESASAFFSAQHIRDVHSQREQTTLIFLEPGKASRFYRDPAGPLVCSIQGRTVCVIELRIRGREIIATSQHFVDLNGKDNPSAFIKPDPVLMDLFPGK